MRHGPDGHLLVPVRAAVAARPDRQSWREWAVFLAGLAIVAAGLAVLLTGPHLLAAAEVKSCPVRSSTAAYSDGQELLLRTEPAVGGNTLLHLCVDRLVGPVRDWSVRVDAGGARAASAGVQGVAPGEALAAIPLAADEQATITVVIVTASGQTLAFVSRVAQS